MKGFKKVLLIALGIVAFTPLLFRIFLEIDGRFFWTNCGPYHHAALVYNSEEEVEFNGKKYYLYLHSLYEVNDGKLKEAEFVNNISSSLRIERIKVYKDKFYISDYSNIYIVNEMLEREKTITLGVYDFLVTDNYIYYIANYYQKDCNFCIYDMETAKSTLLTSDLRNKTYTHNNRLIYVNDSGNIYDITNKETITSYFSESTLDAIPSFYADGKTGEIVYADKKLKITYYGEEFNYDVNMRNIIYDKIIANKNFVTFCSYEYLESDKCNATECICHFGTTYMWRFDMQTKTLEKLKTFTEGAFIINFDENNYCYYQNGKIYRNDQEIKEVIPVEPYGEYMQKGEQSFDYFTKVSSSFFVDDGKDAYQLYEDFKDTLKDQY